MKDGWGPLLIVLYAASQLTSSYLMSQNMQPAQRAMLLILPIAFIPFSPQLPGRPDALLADDEPLDDWSGRHHAAPDAETHRAAETLEQDTAEGVRGVTSRDLVRRAPGETVALRVR